MQQEGMKLIKSGSKDIYIGTKVLYFKYPLFFWMSYSTNNPGKKAV